VIDTGFTGFVSMPLIRAFPLGLILASTVNLVLADGTTVTRLTAYGFVRVENERNPGVIVLDPGADEVLLGMDFLKKFQRTLVVNSNTPSVELIENVLPVAAP